MKLLVNGKEKELDPAVKTVAELLARLEGNFAHSAVALNGSFVPRGEYGSTPVKERDDVEIVVPFPGG